MLVLLTSFYHIHLVRKQSVRNTAVVTDQDVTLLSGPGGDNTILFRVNPGLELKIIGKNREWYQVTASDDIAGWIRKSRTDHGHITGRSESIRHDIVCHHY